MQGEVEPATIVDITLRRRPTCQSRYEDFHYKVQGTTVVQHCAAVHLDAAQEASVLETVVREATARDVKSVALSGMFWICLWAARCLIHTKVPVPQGLKATPRSTSLKNP